MTSRIYKLLAIVVITGLMLTVLSKAKSRLTRSQSWSEALGCFVVDEGSPTIRKPGSYCLDRDITLANRSMAIIASDVVLDLRGHRIRGRADSDDSRPAIKVGKNGVKLDNVRIQNGEIADVHIGLIANSTQDLAVRGIAFSEIGFVAAIVSDGERVVLENNVVDGIGYQAGDSIPDGTGAYSIGFNLNSKDVLVRGNRFEDIRRQPVAKTVVGESVGVIVGGQSRDVTVIGNDFELDGDEVPGSIGIWLAAGTSSLVRENEFRNLERAIAGREASARIVANDISMEHSLGTPSSYGIFLVYAGELSEVTGNSISGYTRPLTGLRPDGSTPIEMSNNTIK